MKETNNSIDVTVNALEGVALDWTVAKACGIEIYRHTGGMISEGEVVLMLADHSAVFAPSANWSHGGPLMEKHKLCTGWMGDEPIAFTRNHKYSDGVEVAPTVLIAACRAIVASVLGPVVSVPKELVHE
jgi:hypothetical protein